MSCAGPQVLTRRVGSDAWSTRAKGLTRLYLNYAGPRGTKRPSNGGTGHNYPMGRQKKRHGKQNRTAKTMKNFGPLGFTVWGKDRVKWLYNPQLELFKRR